MAVKANIVIDQGTDWTVTIDVTDNAGGTYDLTGHTIAAQMRKNYASSTAITFDAVHNSANGQITLSLSSETTTDITPGRYLYDVEMRDSANNVSRVIEGIATVTPGITRV